MKKVKIKFEVELAGSLGGDVLPADIEFFRDLFGNDVNYMIEKNTGLIVEDYSFSFENEKGEKFQ